MNIFIDFHQKFVIRLLQNEVKFIVVGGLSVVFHGYIRTTGDMDLWISPTNENKLKLIDVLSRFGISKDAVDSLWKKDFTEMQVFHINNPPERIEFITKISGLNFEDAFAKCDFLTVENSRVPFLGFDDLIVNKLVTGRLKDQADVEELQKIHRKK
jgi:hypothetical protein